MRMKWKHFVDDLEAELYFHRPFFAGFGNRRDRDANCFWALLENGGGKPRFRAYWEDEGVRDLLYDLDSQDVIFWDHFAPPTEIQCIQGSGGEQILDLNSCLEIPADFEMFVYLYHGTYFSVLLRILKPAGALRPGGARGTDKRSNVYFAMADEREFPARYCPKSEQFRTVRKEPYSFRYDCQVVVRYSHQLVHQHVGACVQTGSLAALGPHDAEIPFECIDNVTDWDGWI
jgi:hypothetical protein